MRHKDVIEKYTRHKGLWTDENSLFAVGEQAAYEWQLDFQAMKWALERIINFLEVAKKHDYFTGTLQIAKSRKYLTILTGTSHTQTHKKL